VASRRRAQVLLAIFIGVFACGQDAHAKKKTVIGELKRMERAGAIDVAEYRERREAYESAKQLVKRLPGRRKVEMAGTVRMLDRFAAQGSLTVSRLEPLWLTLRRNREWWTGRPLLGSGQRVSFPGSELVWQYVPNQGLQLHPLANFGKLNGLWQGKVYDDRLEVLLDELLSVAVERGGALAWEYSFVYNGGRPPWVSGLAQGTAVQALARAGIRLQRKEEVMQVAADALDLFEVRAPVGVRVPIGTGAHYLLYSYDRDLRVLNGFVQALVGIYDYAAYANDDRARRLFADGESVLRRELSRYDTGAWSLYSRRRVQRESDLHYHRLVRGFLDSLCERTAQEEYCSTAVRFGEYLVEKPEVEVLTQRVRGGTTAQLRFTLSKISRVGVRVARGERLVFVRPAALTSYGTKQVAWRVPRKAGLHDVRITAVDLAGNTASVLAQVEVLKPKKRAKRRK
jgi:hypothetical protein